MRATSSARKSADLRSGLPQRRVDRRDRALGGLHGAHGGHEVDHGAGRVDARALQGAGLDRAGRLAAGLAGEVGVALLDRVAQVEERDPGRVDGAVGHGDRLAADAEDLVAHLVDEVALGVGREGAVAGVAHALLGLHAEVAVAGDREVERLARVAQGLRAQVGLLLVDGRALAERTDRRAVSAVALHYVTGRALRDTLGLVAGRRGVG